MVSKLSSNRQAMCFIWNAGPGDALATTCSLFIHDYNKCITFEHVSDMHLNMQCSDYRPMSHTKVNTQEEVFVSCLTRVDMSCWHFIITTAVPCMLVCLLPNLASSILLCKQLEFETRPPPSRAISLLWWEAGLISFPNSHHTCRKIEKESWGWVLV